LNTLSKSITIFCLCIAFHFDGNAQKAIELDAPVQYQKQNCTHKSKVSKKFIEFGNLENNQKNGNWWVYSKEENFVADRVYKKGQLTYDGLLQVERMRKLINGCWEHHKLIYEFQFDKSFSAVLKNPGLDPPYPIQLLSTKNKSVYVSTVEINGDVTGPFLIEKLTHSQVIIIYDLARSKWKAERLDSCP